MPTKNSTFRSNTWLPSRCARIARFVADVVQLRRPISSSAPHGLFETCRPSCSRTASYVRPSSTVAMSSPPSEGSPESNRVLRGEEGAFLLRRRLPILIHGGTCSRGRPGRWDGRDRVAALRAAARAAPAARGAGRPPAYGLDRQRLPAGPGARHRDPPTSLPAALDAPACRLPVGR